MVAARFLLKPGRKYEEAVEQFSPYKSVKEVNAEARAAGKTLIQRAKQQGKQAFIYVNNRLEDLDGSAGGGGRLPSEIQRSQTAQPPGL